MNTENRKTNDPHKFLLNFVTEIRFKKINMSLLKIYMFITCGKI